MRWNIRRGLVRIWIVVSILYLAPLAMLGGPDVARNIRAVGTSNTSAITGKKNAAIVERQPRDLFADLIPNNKDDLSQLSDAELDAEIARLEGEVRRDREIAVGNLKASAAVAIIPLAIWWGLLGAGFWIASGFRDGR